AKESRALAEKEARLAAQEEAKQVRQIKNNLKEIEITCQQLRVGEIGTKEALDKLTDITEKITQ
ncbi:MAG: hypothetical protein HYU83_03880, partial [Chloroflexi bacterium]|nr:hypothetical protein [Chloroflexota bacterium]